MKKADIVIKNGLVFNSVERTFEKRNLAVCDGRITDGSEAESADTVMDASGCMVLPGLVDFHTHLFHSGSSFGMHADLLFSTGVTTAVDMGSAGCANFEAFLKSDLLPAKMDTKAYLNVSPLGQIGYGINEPLDDAALSHPEFYTVIKQYADKIRGIKIRISKPIVGELELKPLYRAIELAEDAGFPLCVHTTNPPASQGEVAKALRPGDIFSHVFHKSGLHILDSDGNVLQELWDAKKRGVKFDVGNGRVNFNFDVAEAAIKQKFYPDYISTDATPKTFNASNAMKNLPYVMSKFVSMGMPVEEVISACTLKPAQILGMEDEIGTLDTGSRADIMICKWEDKKVNFEDSDGNKRVGSSVMIPQVTIQKGKVVFCHNDFMFEEA